MTGYLSLVLHCHLPFVRHPEHEYFLEENWYNEALFETYLPLLAVFEKLEEEKIPFRLTLSVSPTLLSMCLDPLLQRRALRYCDELIGLAEKEEKRTRTLPELQPVLRMYLVKLRNYREQFVNRYHHNVMEGLRRFQDLGRLEIITCGATHGYFPLLGSREAAVRAQVLTALDLHRSFFGRESIGFWLPECGYQPGLESLLKETGIQYFFVESHGLLQASPRPKYGTFAPIVCASGTAVFGRDMESAKQVWSSKEGYPGDQDYREFYRDAGYDLSEGDLHPFLKPEGLRRFTGLKYYRVTGATDQKEPYDPGRALKKAEWHALDFLERRKKQAAEVSQWMDRPPLINCLYDAELFGHWWYEGPDFLYFFLKQNHQQGSPLELVTPSDYLRKFPVNQPAQPVFSSWGLGGYSEFWLNETNDWIYPHLNKACDEMVQLASHPVPAAGFAARALNQATRELLLAQASDWAFMMKAGNYRSYAEKGVKTHLIRFHQLARQILHQDIDVKYLVDLEEKDNLFPQVDYRVFRTEEKKKNYLETDEWDDRR